MHISGVNSPANRASFAEFIKREKERADGPCEKAQDGVHNWQFREFGRLGGMPVYDCDCGAVEVIRKTSK